MHPPNPSQIGSSIMLAIGAVAITAAVVFGAGALVLPDPASDASLDDVAAVPTVENLTGSQAILTLSGDHQGRHELNRVSVGEWNEGNASGQPLKLSLTYRSHNASLLITATDITTDAPAEAESASAVIGVEGANYFGNNGECTITLAWVDYQVIEPLPGVLDGVPRGVPIPTYVGAVECHNIKEIRTDRHIDLHAVFQHQPQQ